MTNEMIIAALCRARDRFLQKHPSFSTEHLKGRNHVRRTVFVSNLMTILAAKCAGNNLSAQLSGGLYQGYATIYPTEFVEMVAEEMGVPATLLVNSLEV